MSTDTRNGTNRAYTNERERSQSDELWRYLAPYVRWRWLLGLCVVIGVVGTFAVTKLQPPVYRATAVLVVDSETAPAPDEGTQLAITYAQLVTRPIVMLRAARLAGNVSASSLMERVQSTVESNTGLIDVAVDDTSPSRAAAQANAVASAFTLVLAEQGLEAKYPVVVFQQAVPPTVPDHPNPVRNAFFGGALAFALAVALIHLLNLWDIRPELAGFFAFGTAAEVTAEANQQIEADSANGAVGGKVDRVSMPHMDAAVWRAESVPPGDGA